MKYSNTDRPSRNEERIGRGICWPLELATTPFMPASERTWIQLPAAPACTRVETGLSFGYAAGMASSISLVAASQIFTRSSLRSAWREVAALVGLLDAFRLRSRAGRRISSFSGGMMTSPMATVMPERVAQWKPASLSRSRVCATDGHRVVLGQVVDDQRPAASWAARR